MADSDKRKRIENMVGKVVRAPFATGSKSEREAIWLETDGRRWVLRRKGGPSFDDRALEKFVGRRVRCDGFSLDYTLLADRIEPID